ncbi:MAG: helix-turn-helix transcriptional regulator [Clostridia bacterium]|nr:helix-turn-helix transcriptional regulator [Clostridia bacterium]
MDGTIYKFERDMLHGRSIHIRKKTDELWYKKHWHNYYEIIYYHHCAGTCELNGKRHELTERCLFLLTPKDFHKIDTVPQKDNYSLIIGFDEQIADSAIVNALTTGPFVAKAVSEELHRKLDELYRAESSQKPFRDTYVKHLFNCILLDILETADPVSEQNHTISPIIGESISAMLCDPTAEFSLDFFARKYHLTPSYFSRLFHAQVGISFKQYLTTLRLSYAKQLLAQSTPPIIDVGYECGFNTPSQFYRAFKGCYGLSPSAYRKQHGN